MRTRLPILPPGWLYLYISNDDLDTVRPFEDAPCLHHRIADCKPDPEAILQLANSYGLLTAAPEPLDLWRETIRTLRNPSASKLAEKLQSARFQLIASPENGAVVLRYRSTRFIDAIYQRFAEELSGLIACTKCPAPNCGRWFLKSAGRGDSKVLFSPLQNESVSAGRRP
jgi:hypothetical protein